MNGFDKYFLESTEDACDRAAEIEANLAEYGACMLGTGDFYVSGIKMPAGSSLFGLGKATRIILNPELESGTAVAMASYTEIKDMTIMGATEDITRPDSVGNRHGITFIGTATPTDFSGQLKNSIIYSWLFRWRHHLHRYGIQHQRIYYRHKLRQSREYLRKGRRHRTPFRLCLRHTSCNQRGK